MIQVVWFKRDLRIRDHAPLAEAAVAGPVPPLYVVEPDYWRLPVLLFGAAGILGRCGEAGADRTPPIGGTSPEDPRRLDDIISGYGVRPRAAGYFPFSVRSSYGPVHG